MYRKEEHILEEELRELCGKTYPFHMPGHKRTMAPVGEDITSFDLTEITGADDLHEAEDILKDAMDRTAKLFHAKRTWYLVGGSTVGVLAMVRAALPEGAEIIAARNAHKSFCHIAELMHLRVHWVSLPVDPVFGVQDSVDPKAIEAALLRFPESRAVYLTSPTYEGAVSDIRSIADICHAHDIPCLVDEAHGAHLGLFKEGGFPESAISCGADLVVQSAHKTLPSLTQTALLHLGTDHIDPAAVEQQLNIFETSSPSYPLMASLDGCTGILAHRGKELFASWKRRLDNFENQITDLSHVRVLCYGKDKDREHPGIYAFDRSKLLIQADGMTGQESAEFLRKEWGLECEMACGRNVLLMTSCADSDEAMEKLSAALHALDEKTSGSSASVPSFTLPPIPEQKMTIADALHPPRHLVPLAESVGRVAASYLYPYPPGVPVIVPGEVITREEVDYLVSLKASGAKIVSTSGKEGQVFVL